MAEKSDDIKNLFLNLGLNPSDYHEIRTAPTANATVSEAPRRWSLLQSAAAPKPVVTPAVPVIPAAAPAPVPAPAATQAQAEAFFAANMLPAALLAAAQDIARAEATGAPFAAEREPEPVAADRAPPAAAPLPAALSNAFAQAGSNDGLQSLFQSVKEPQTAAARPSSDDAARPTERRTDQLYGRTPVAPSLAERAAAVPEVRTQLLPTPPRLVDHNDEPETRHAPPLSRLGPVPVAAPITAPSVPMLSVGEGRLRFAAPAVESSGAHGESLQDVFRRLSRDNRS